MKQLISFIITIILVLCLGSAVNAEEGQVQNPNQTVTEEKTESGTTRITIDNGKGHVFTIEEVPEYGNGDILVIETPVSEEIDTNKSFQGESVESDTSEAQSENGSSAWLFIGPGVLVIAGTEAFFLLRRKK